MVSVLDLDSYVPCGPNPRPRPTRRDQHETDVYLSERCQKSPDWTAKRANALGDQIGGGAYRDRTGDRLLAKQALSQLS